jgi:hypothetical protein
MTEAVQTPIEELLRMSSKAEGWKTYSERGEGVLLESRHHNDLHDLAASEIETLRAENEALKESLATIDTALNTAIAMFREGSDINSVTAVLTAIGKARAAGEGE